MNVTDLVDLYRSRTHDIETPYLWSDTEIWGYIDYAQRRLLRPMGGIRESQSSLCTLVVPATVSYVPIDPLILKIHRANIPANAVSGVGPGYTGTVKLLDRVHTAALAKERPGDLFALVFGEDDNGARAVYVPNFDTTINFLISRLPLPIIDDTSKLEAREEWHYMLIFGMLEQGYLKQDAETRNDKLSKENGDKFDDEIERASRDTSLRRAAMTGVQYGGL